MSTHNTENTVENSESKYSLYRFWGLPYPTKKQLAEYSPQTPNLVLRLTLANFFGIDIHRFKDKNAQGQLEEKFSNGRLALSILSHVFTIPVSLVSSPLTVVASVIVNPSFLLSEAVSNVCSRFKRSLFPEVAGNLFGSNSPAPAVPSTEKAVQKEVSGISTSLKAACSRAMGFLGIDFGGVKTGPSASLACSDGLANNIEMSQQPRTLSNSGSN